MVGALARTVTLVALLLGGPAACHDNFGPESDGDADGDGDGDVDGDGDADGGPCDPGYRLEGTLCVDIDECAEGTAACEPGSTCTNTDGGYSCPCRAGYRATERACEDIDECAEGTAGCDPVAICENLEGSFDCNCPPGYRGNGESCEDIDECATGADDCHALATCTNLPGSYECTCREGFEGNGRSCTDLDECERGVDGCADEALCHNTDGAYTCTCLAGTTDLSGDGRDCERSRRAGHLVLVGHDFYERAAASDAIVGNAIYRLAPPGPIRVLEYTEHADMAEGGEPSNTRAAIAAHGLASGRSVTYTSLDDYRALPLVLADHEVLLVYEQENASEAELVAIGDAWARALAAFLEAGGLVVVCDYSGGDSGTFRVLEAAGVLSVSSSESVSLGASLEVASPSHPLAIGVSSPYSAPNGTRAYSTLDGVAVVTAGGVPVVVHKRFVHGADLYALPWDFYEWTDESAAVLFRAVTVGFERLPRVAAVQQCADRTSPTGTSPSGSFAGEYNATLGALAYAGYPRTDVIDLATAATAGSRLADYDVLLFVEQESCAVAAGEWIPIVAEHVGRGGRVVVTTPSSGTAAFLSGLGLFGTGSETSATTPFAAEADPFWDGIVMPAARLNATGGWAWSGRGVGALARGATADVLLVWQHTFAD